MLPFLTMRANSTPANIALVIDSRSFTYAELNTRVNQLANGLRAAGAAEGTRIGVLLPTGLDYVLLIHAVQKLGAVLVLLNMRLSPRELDQQLQIADCPIVVYNRLTAPVREALQTPGFAWAMEDLLRASDAPPPEPDVTLDDPLAIVFTSGTSGSPKGVVLTSRNFLMSAMASAYHLDTLTQDRWLCVLPLYHVGGLSILIRACLYGITADLMNSFDVERVLARLTQTPITLVSVVPTMLYRLLEHGMNAAALPHLRLILVGGAATTPQLLERARAAALPIATTYGMSEATSQVATALPTTALHKAGTVGKPLPFVQVRILRADGSLANTDEAGEIAVRGEIVMQGYINNPDATANALRHGWLMTGDIGSMDAEGDLFVLERRTDLIISGGENIYPAEIEAVLRAHPAVAEAVAVGLPDEEWGQRVAVAVTLQPGATTDTSALLAHALEHLARYKQPRLIRILNALPMTASGKIIRQRVREILIL